MSIGKMRGKKMKTLEYLEGKQATENFEEGMKTLFKAPKTERRRKSVEAARSRSLLWRKDVLV